MAMSGEFAPEEQGQAESNYPTAFGITFTPVIGGVCLGVLGVLGAAYLWLNVVSPQVESRDALQNEVADLEAQEQQLAASASRIKSIEEQIAEAQVRREAVVEVFAGPETLQTLLLDLNSIVDSRQIEMINFTPAEEVIPLADGRLEQRNYTVEIQGNFSQVQSVVREIEQLQPLLLITELTSTKVEQDEDSQVLINREGKVVSQPTPKIQTTFTLQAITPPEGGAPPPDAAEGDEANGANPPPQ